MLQNAVLQRIYQKPNLEVMLDRMKCVVVNHKNILQKPTSTQAEWMHFVRTFWQACEKPLEAMFAMIDVSKTEGPTRAKAFTNQEIHKIRKWAPRQWAADGFEK